MAEKQWILRKPYPDSFAKTFSQEDDIALGLLFSRGVRTKEDRDRFLNPDYEKDLHDPFSMKGMEKAVQRILKAVSSKEKMLIFGDYDADGVCAAAIFHDFFKKIKYENFEVYIPDRHREGHGLKNESVENFAAHGTNLLITVDCGISNCKEILLARQKGIDVIVIDHHPPGLRLPDAFSVLNPGRKDCSYPFKFLSGAGLAFKTISALLKKGGFPVASGWEKWLLDLAAVSTVADMVSLTGENRVIVHYGLKVLKKTKRPGFKALYRKLGINPASISEDDIGFVIAPHINAASRMEHARVSFLLLSTDSDEEAERMALRLVGKNKERKIIVEEITSEIRETIGKMDEVPDFIVAGKKEWRPGILGIVANKILEEFGRSVFLWGKAKADVVRGSARGNGTVNLVRLMEKVPGGFFDDFGGHELAAAFSFHEKKAGIFEKEMNEAWRLHSAASEDANSQKNIYEDIVYEKEISLDEISRPLLERINRFRPFGFENSKPIFVFRNVLPERAKLFGNGQAHLRLDFRNSKGTVFSAIGFFVPSEILEKANRGILIDLAFSVEETHFKGYDELRLRIVDLKESA